jgi:hypothetical protein
MFNAFGIQTHSYLMGGPKNSFFHLKLIEKMSFYLNFRAHKGSVSRTGTVFETALIIIQHYVHRYYSRNDMLCSFYIILRIT